MERLSDVNLDAIVTSNDVLAVVTYYGGDNVELNLYPADGTRIRYDYFLVGIEYDDTIYASLSHYYDESDKLDIYLTVFTIDKVVTVIRLV